MKKNSIKTALIITQLLGFTLVFSHENNYLVIKHDTENSLNDMQDCIFGGPQSNAYIKFPVTSLNVPFTQKTIGNPKTEFIHANALNFGAFTLGASYLTNRFLSTFIREEYVPSTSVFAFIGFAYFMHRKGERDRNDSRLLRKEVQTGFLENQTSLAQINTRLETVDNNIISLSQTVDDTRKELNTKLDSISSISQSIKTALDTPKEPTHNSQKFSQNTSYFKLLDNDALISSLVGLFNVISAINK